MAVPQQVAIGALPFSNHVASRDGTARRQRGPDNGVAPLGAGQQLLRRGAEQARVRPAQGDEPALHLLIRGTPSVAFLRWCLDRLSTGQSTRVLTGALAPAEQVPFLEAGFSVLEHLCLLELVLGRGGKAPDRPSRDGARRRHGGWALRRARGTDRSQVLSVDHAAFDPFWRLDSTSLDEALAATPGRRYRVAVWPRSPLRHGRVVAGYAVTGLALDQGYIQRLAVHPDVQSKGAGRALLADGLRWLERRDATRVLVNTQETNERALGLYASLGFRPSPERLSVLCATLTGRAG
ncbi:MAG: GNAT family N-acetyltransferase [Acidimicrobiales bacterium]|nr:GNAT family N-acetyltransferase [Acidimicrobiales bacterium]